MNEVSCRANRALLDAASSFGVDVEPLLEGLNVSRAHLVDPYRRIDWSLHVEILARLERTLESPWALSRVGAISVSTPGSDLLRRLSRHVASAKELHRAVMRWVLPALFPHLVFRFEDGGGRLVHTYCDIPSEHAGSRAFFHVASGAASHATELLGLPPASIETDIHERRAAFHLTLPREPNFLRTFQRRATALLRPSAFLQELESQEATMRASYEALLRTRDDFRRVMDRLSIGVMVHRRGTVIYANSALAQMLGYQAPSHMIGMEALSFVHPDDREMAGARMQLPPDTQTSPRQYRAVRTDGVVLSCEIMPAQEVTLDGAPARLITVRDLSEKKRQEEQMVLADRMAAVGALAASVAHEINNPLAYAWASLEVVERATRALVDPPPSLAPALSTARDGLERVRAIVSDLKTLSRPDEERRDPIDVHAVLDSTLRLASRELGLRARVTRFYGTSLHALASTQRLGQVFLNLLINAAEAIPPGDDPARHEIRVTTMTDEEGRVVVEVGDTGGGIADEVASRLFEPFFTTKPVGAGTGLGLAICHRIVGRLGGEISVRSLVPEEEQDDRPRELRTVFRVALPATLGGRDLAPSSNPPSGRRAKILVVDDEPALLSALRESLAPHHDVTIADCGQRALDVLRAGATFDMVLCDVMMAGLSGIDVFEAICRERADLAEHVVFMTGGAYSPSVRSFLAARPNRHLEKPFATQEVLRVVARHTRLTS